MRPNLRRLLLSLGLPPLLAACAATPADAVGGEMRVLVKVVEPGAAPDAVAILVKQTSGHATRYVASAGGGWHSLAIRCAGPAECDAALRRLSAEPTRIVAAQRDGRKTLVTP